MLRSNHPLVGSFILLAVLLVLQGAALKLLSQHIQASTTPFNSKNQCSHNSTALLLSQVRWNMGPTLL